MRNRTLNYIAFVLVLTIALSGCARPKNWLVSEHETISAFSFGEIGGMTIGVSNHLDIDGHPNSLLLPIMTQSFQDSLRTRGLEVGEAKPVAGIVSSLDEFKMSGRFLTMTANWQASGTLAFSGTLYGPGGKLVHVLRSVYIPALASMYYTNDEEFYTGLKKDIAPVVSKALDMIFKDFAARGVAIQ